MIRTFRTVLHLSQTKRRHWIGIVLLALVVSAMEAAAAAILFSLLALLTESFTSGSLPLISELRQAVPNLPRRQLFAVGSAAAVVVFIVRAGAYVLLSYAQNRLANTTARHLATRLLRIYLGLPYEVHLRRNSAELIRNVHMATYESVGSVFLPAMSLASESLLVLAILTVLFVRAPALTLVAFLVLAPVLWFLFRIVQRRLGELGEKSLLLLRKTLQSLQQTIHGVRDIKVLGREDFFVDEFDSDRSDLAQTSYLRGMLLDVPRVVLESTIMVLLFAFLGVFVLRSGAVDATLPVLGLFAYAVLRLLPSANRILTSLNALRYAQSLLHTLATELSNEATARARSVRRSMQFEREIRLEDVGYVYEDSPAPALHGVDFTVRCGEKVGVVGASGSGKTTLLDVVVGLLPPTSGCISADGVDIRVDVRAWQAKIGMVAQSVFLIDDTLERNIALGVPEDEIDEERLHVSLEVAQLDSLVRELPKGTRSLLGERGARLSGGERQRVAIARALYQDPAVLVLDEATSALDAITEENLIESLERQRQRTVISVAHRISSLRGCDRIIFMKDGRIADSGSYFDLHERNPEFRRMAKSRQEVTATES